MASIKTAVSIDEKVFKKTEELAEEMKVSRSRLFSMALENFIKEIENKKLLEGINAACKIAEKEDEEYIEKMKNYRKRNLEAEE